MMIGLLLSSLAQAQTIEGTWVCIAATPKSAEHSLGGIVTIVKKDSGYVVTGTNPYKIRVEDYYSGTEKQIECIFTIDLGVYFADPTGLYLIGTSSFPLSVLEKLHGHMMDIRKVIYLSSDAANLYIENDAVECMWGQGIKGIRCSIKPGQTQLTYERKR